MGAIGGLATGCVENGPKIGNLPSIPGTIPNVTATDAQVMATNPTGLAAVTFNTYPNPWGIVVSDEPNIYTRNSNDGYVYRAPNANTPLYSADKLPHSNDVTQKLGNSSFMGALASLADRLPGFTKAGIRYVSDNPDGSRNYVVRLWGPTPSDPNNYYSQWIPTDDRLLTSPTGGAFGSTSTVIWPALYEKAFAKLASLTHQVGGDITVTGYDTQDLGYGTTGLASLTGLVVDPFWNTGDTDPNTPLRNDVVARLAGVNTAATVMGAYTFGFNDIVGWSDFNATSQTVPLPGGATLGAAPNPTSLLYTSSAGATVELIFGMEYSVLATNNGAVLLRNTWGHVGDGSGLAWLPQNDFLRAFRNAYAASDPNHTLGAAAPAHVP